MSILINDIIRSKMEIDVDLSKASWKVKPGLEARRNMALKEHQKLINQYKQHVAGLVYKAFISGVTTAGLEKLVTLLKKEKVFAVPVNHIYGDIAKSVEIKLSSGRNYSTPAFLELTQVCGALSGFYRTLYNRPISQKGIGTGVQTFPELETLVRDRVREAYGDALNREHIHDQVFKRALDTKFWGDRVLVLVPNTNTDERQSLFDTLFPDRPSFTIDLEGEEPTKAHALKIVQKLGITDGEKTNNKENK